MNSKVLCLSEELFLLVWLGRDEAGGGLETHAQQASAGVKGTPRV